MFILTGIQCVVCGGASVYVGGGSYSGTPCLEPRSVGRSSSKASGGLLVLLPFYSLTACLSVGEKGCICTSPGTNNLPAVPNLA